MLLLLYMHKKCISSSQWPTNFIAASETVTAFDEVRWINNNNNNSPARKYLPSQKISKYGHPVYEGWLLMPIGSTLFIHNSWPAVRVIRIQKCYITIIFYCPASYWRKTEDISESFQNYWGRSV